MWMKSRYIVITLLLIALAFYIGFKSNEVEVVKTVTKTVTNYETVTEVIDNTKPTKVEKVYIKVPIHDTVKQIDTIYEQKQVKKYTYVDSLKNGRLEATILADNIYKRDIKLDVFNEVTTKTVTNTVVKNSIMLGVDTNINAGIQQTSLNLYFIKGDKWLVKGGFGYDITRQSHFYSVGVAFKF